MSVNHSSSFGFSPRLKTLAAALSLALVGLSGGANPADAAEKNVQLKHYSQNKPHHANAPHHALDLSKVRDVLTKFAQKKPAGPPLRSPQTLVISSMSDGGFGSLRDALSNAVDGDVIDIRKLHGTLTLSSALQTSASVTINGPGKDLLTLDGGGHSRVIESAYPLKLSNITVAHGAVASSSPPVGGCLYVAGDLYLYDATITGCSAGDATSYFAYGGAVAVLGDVTLKYSEISNSSVTAYHAGGGGGLVNVSQSSDALQVISSTITGNSVTVVSSPENYMAVGGGVASVYNSGPGTLGILFGASLVTNNSVSGPGYYNATYGAIYPATKTYGGGIWAGGEFVVSIGSTISGNSLNAGGTAYGGGIYSSVGVYAGASTLKQNSVASTEYWVYGGGAMSAGPLGFSNSIISGNTAQSACGYSYNFTCFIAGGALFSKTGIEAKYTTLSGNSLTATGYYNRAYGGGLASVGPDGITLTNSTVSGNSVINTQTYYGVYNGYIYGGAFGGGAATVGYPTAAPLHSYNSTIAANSSTTIDGGIFAGSGSSVSLFSTIVATNTSQYDTSTNDIGSFVPVTIAGDHDLVMAAESDVTLPGGTLSSDPMLLPLANNGGFTMTHALDPASPAIDTGSNPESLSSDQRGPPYARVVGGGPDIGAFELDSDRIFANGFDFFIPPPPI